jgi:predicted DCC family thiol-disulfide oxidoreductase YuxK
MSDKIHNENPVVLFDGVCNLCNGFVQFVIPRDPDGTLKFASLQSDVGQELLVAHDLPTDSLNSLVFVENGDCYVKSAAVARIAAHLNGLYPLLSVLNYLPRPIRDRAYDFVAARRYQWFGQKDQCMMPTGDVQSRFLE